MIKEEKNALIYFKKLMVYDNSEFDEIKLENIIFLYFINDEINTLINKDTNL